MAMIEILLEQARREIERACDAVDWHWDRNEPVRRLDHALDLLRQARACLVPPRDETNDR